MNAFRLHLRTAAITVVVGLVCASSLATAQIPLPGLGQGESTVRLADPKEQLAATARAIETRRQAVMLRSGDADRWQARRGSIAGELSALELRRAALWSRTEPDRKARRWKPSRSTPTPDEAPPPLPDIEPRDAGTADAGASDAQTSDASSDAGVPDAVVDAAPPPPKPARAQILPAIETGGGWLVPGTHPAELAEVERAIRALRRLDATLASLIRLHEEESAQLAAALDQVEQMQRSLAEADDEGEATPGLRKVERLALGAHRAGIALALARAQQRQSVMDDADAAETVDRRRAAIAELEPLDAGELEPWQAFAESFGRAEQQRDRVEEARRETFAVIEPLGQLTERVAAARQERYEMEAKNAQQSVDRARAAYAESLDRMVITPDDREKADSIYTRSQAHRAKNMPALEQQLDQLRVVGEGTVQSGTGPFADIQVRRLQRTVIGEKLLFERTKLQRDVFRRDLVVAVDGMLEGTAPGPAFGADHVGIIDEARFESRTADLSTRCEGWRRAHATLRKKTASPALAKNAAELDAQYAELDDLCRRQDMVLATQGRLGDIARFQLQRFAARDRSMWWYAARLGISLLALILLLFFSRLLGIVTRRLAGRRPGEGSAARMGLARLRSLGALMLYLVLLGALWLGVGVLAANRIWVLELDVDRLLDFAVRPIFFVGDAALSLWSIVRLVGWTIAALWTGRLVQQFSGDLMEHFAIEDALRHTFGTLVRYLTIAVGIAVGLSAVGIGFGALAVLFGVIGIGIGFGLQTIASNFISGFIILIERPIRQGDFVQVGDMVGEVRAIRARATTIETRDGVTVIVPNSEFVTDRVINWTLGRGERMRGRVEVGVAYGTDVEQARGILADVAAAHPKVLETPSPDVRLVEFGDSSLDLVMLFWTRDVRGLPRLVSDLNRAIEEAFAHAEISIPYPHTDVTVRQVSEDEAPEDDG